MAAAADHDEEEVEVQASDTKDKTTAAEAKALGKMTSAMPEQQDLDENKVKKAMMALAAAQKAGQDAARQRERELASVKVNKEDIDVIASEMEVDKKLAERRLREHGADLAAALKSFM